jgi:hypothetical protein
LRVHALAAALLVLSARPGLAAERSSCEHCHSDAERVGGDSVRLVEEHARSVHAEAGLSCHDCHGGNPDPALADDAQTAMDPSFAPRPFLGAPRRPDVPGFCGRSHTDPLVMRRFDPGARVDQEREYWTSDHGRALEHGDPGVATCIECHGTHGILRIADPDSPVHPTRVAETCASCHADAGVMAGRTGRGGEPLPVDQYALWRGSVHAAALLEREDLSAPTCNDCHGNHGATPPDVDSVAQVCGQCHGREAVLFRQSAKRAGLERHDGFLAEAGPEGCAACHAEPEPQARLRDVRSLGECAACHGHHGVVRPSVALLAPLPGSPCAFCHEAPGPTWEPVLGGEVVAEHYRTVRDGLFAAAQGLGLADADRFDWLVDQALSLPFHTLAPGELGGAPRLRPEFERLFAKFRIGRTRLRYEELETGRTLELAVRRCSTCHASDPLLADAPRGLRVSGDFVERMRELTALTAMAERTVLRARRGGVATDQALLAIDESVDAQVELEVLVHGFSADPGSEFVRKHAEGVEHAKRALALAEQAQDELESRRRALAGFLIVVIFALLSLGLKIRQVSARARREVP